MVDEGYRIKVSNFSICKICGKSCKKCLIDFSNAITVAKLFKAYGNLEMIIDSKNPKFLKGGIANGKVFGGKINVLPDGKKLDKAYSLFAPGLILHNEKSNSHWNVIFKNPNGKFTYIYTLEKKKISTREKYKKVDEFEKCLPILKHNLIKSLNKDSIVLPMIILLKTKMRVGNEIYYKQDHHKGLTTLKKRDIKITGNQIIFEYIAKDGVPQKIIESFSKQVIKKLKDILKAKKLNDFVFVDSENHPLKDIVFEQAFEKYCGKKFYPHIVRSHYATKEAEKFLEGKKKISKDDAMKFYLKIAEKLGHKKFSKEKKWENSYQVTLHYYVRPKLVKQIEKKIIKI